MSFAIKPWMCSCCGYAMDAASHANPKRENDPIKPKEGDMALCLNCGCAHVMKGEDWKKAEREDLVGVEPRVLAEMGAVKFACQLRRAIMGDLAKKEGGTA